MTTSSPALCATWLLRFLGWLGALATLMKAMYLAYDIRLFAIKAYGPVIHEFDPWFNFRATEYLANKGWRAFFTWFDHMSWYPLGRPVGTTIYPGMQIAAVAIWRGLDRAAAAAGLSQHIGGPWSLNDVCCYVPAWFGVVATVFTALLTHEGMLESPPKRSSLASLVAGGAIMAIIPAHAQRSVGGGFDNESVAMSAMCATFYFWTRSLRGDASWPIGVASGLAYTCMAATWGGYIFVLNVVGAHAAVLLLLGYDHRKLHRAYTAFFIVGTAGAMLVPVIGWAPLRSLEQLGPLAVFVAVQLVALHRRFASVFPGVGKGESEHQATVSITLAVAVVALAVLVPSGFFGSLSARVKALFGVDATKTGNPLVDSVSEHRPSSPDAYWKYLHYAGYVAIFGPVALLTRRQGWPSEAALFLLVHGGAAHFFSLKMSRLMLLMGPACSAHAGAAIGCAFDFAMSPVWRTLESSPASEALFYVRLYNSAPVRLLRLALAGAFVWYYAWAKASTFYDHCVDTVRWSLSHPQIMTKDANGAINDELREAYWWLRDNTPADARVLAWWDYGYQIAGIANRTTIADGNTWNMDHIGLLGLALSSPVPEGHCIIRHLADFVLLWSDDIGKSIHMAKISNDIFPGHCEEPDCDQWGTFRDGSPTPMTRASVLWGLLRDTPQLEDRYREVYVSRHGKVHIAQVLSVSSESKAWVADPRSKVCDAPGSWYCPGRYPPLLRQLMGWDPAQQGNAEAAAYRQAYEARKQAQALAKPGPNAPDIPKGSYLRSCKGCSVAGGRMLSCQRCVSPGHASQGSTLDYSTCPPDGLVDNIHGELQCKPLPNQPDVPQGGYLSSCLGCRLQDGGAVLQCSHCSTADGHRRASSMDLRRCPSPPAFLDNSNGHLTCAGLPHDRGVPRGGYQRSCQGCAMEQSGALLRCAFCAASSGTQLEASIEVSQCPSPGSIDNSNGALVCRGLPNAADIPPGGYKESCGGCHTRAGQLQCTYCFRANGHQSQASLDLDRCPPPAKVDNSDGRLICLQ